MQAIYCFDKCQITVATECEELWTIMLQLDNIINLQDLASASGFLAKLTVSKWHLHPDDSEYLRIERQ